MSKTVKFWRFRKGQEGLPNDLLALKTGDGGSYDDGPIKKRIKAVEDTTAELKSEQSKQAQRVTALETEKEWVLKGTITSTSSTVRVDFANCTEFVIFGKCNASSTIQIGTNISNLLYNAIQSGGNSFCARFSDAVFGLECLYAKRIASSASDSPNNDIMGYCWTGGKHTSDITMILVSTAITDGEIKIYAR